MVTGYWLYDSWKRFPPAARNSLPFKLGASYGCLKNEFPYRQGLDPYRALGIRVLEAIAIWIIGRWLIGLALRIIGRGMARQKIDPTVIRYIQNAVAALLNIVLVIAILNFFGVETTSLAALIAAGGVAVGLAWSGLLANFAAGVFMVILQPSKSETSW
jgi:small-conductance mechanosensitive channel